MQNATFAPEEQMFYLPKHFQNYWNVKIIFVKYNWKFEVFIEMMQCSKYSIWGKGLKSLELPQELFGIISKVVWSYLKRCLELYSMSCLELLYELLEATSKVLFEISHEPQGLFVGNMFECRSRVRQFDSGQVPYFCGDWSEIISTVILLLPLIQEGLLSVTSKSMCTKYWLTI